MKTVATTGDGVPELMEAIAAFREHASGTSVRGAARAAESRLREIVSERLMSDLEQRVLAPGELTAMVDRVAARELDPYTRGGSTGERAFAG